ncbi:hypothetical protein [Staphylococcus hyicus]|uniref:hypothetical protein n=1 Tax=Staphylococcus hyicus TaxID=1284 RepID=UPI003132D23B
MRDCKLRQSIWYFLFNEYLESDDVCIEHLLDDIIQGFKMNIVAIASSNFGMNYTYDSEVVFIPSSKQLVKNICNLDTGIDLTEYITFDSVEEIEEYFGNVSYDDLLYPSFDENVLDELTKNKFEKVMLDVEVSLK